MEHHNTILQKMPKGHVGQINDRSKPAIDKDTHQKQWDKEGLLKGNEAGMPLKHGDTQCHQADDQGQPFTDVHAQPAQRKELLQEVRAAAAHTALVHEVVNAAGEAAGAEDGDEDVAHSPPAAQLHQVKIKDKAKPIVAARTHMHKEAAPKGGQQLRAICNDAQARCKAAKERAAAAQTAVAELLAAAAADSQCLAEEKIERDSVLKQFQRGCKEHLMSEKHYLEQSMRTFRREDLLRAYAQRDDALLMVLELQELVARATLLAQKAMESQDTTVSELTVRMVETMTRQRMQLMQLWDRHNRCTSRQLQRAMRAGPGAEQQLQLQEVMQQLMDKSEELARMGRIEAEAPGLVITSDAPHSVGQSEVQPDGQI